MGDENWVYIEQLFEKALELPKKERETWLRAECSEDSQIYREVKSLLEAHREAEGFLEGSVLDTVPDLVETMKTTGGESFHNKKELGPYKIIKELGYGGMGVVFLAEHSGEHIDRQVALKVLRAGFSRKSIIRRFIQEQQVLSKLEHPGIARLYDAGIIDGNQPYFAMEYIDGVPIDVYCKENDLSLKERLLLFVKVCEAVQYAHRNLIVHRDLKPTNILVDDDGMPRLLDFGIAKLINGNKEASKAITQTGRRWMTPEYAAPEQIKEETVSVSTDIYALGILLHKLLAGTTPFHSEGITTRELERRICEEYPTRPSSIAAHSNQSKVFGEKLKGDLDTIILKALRKEPERRYNSAETLIDDIRRYFNHFPVRARRDTIAYRAKKFVRRHRLSLASAAAIVLLIAGFALFHTVQITQERDRAQTAAKKAEAVTEFTISLFDQADPYDAESKKEVEAALTLLKPSVQHLRTKLDNQPEIKAELLYKFGVLYNNLGQYDRSKTLLQQALVIHRSFHNPPSEELAATLHAYGTLMILLAPDSASTYFEQAAQMRRDIYKGDNEKLAKSLLQWSRFLPLDDPAKKPLFHKAIDMFRRLYGQRSARVADALHKYYVLGYATHDQTVIAKAFQKALTIQKKELGLMNIKTAVTMHDLGLVLEDIGKQDTAFKVLKHSYRIGKKTEGLRNKFVRTMGINVAATFYEHQRYLETDSILRDIMTYSRSFLPDSSEGVAYISYWYGENLIKLNRFGEAEKSLRKSLAIYQKLYTNGWRTWMIQNMLGRLLIKKGQYREAEHELIDNFKYLRKHNGINNNYTQTSIALLTQLYDVWDKPKKTAQYHKLLVKED